MSPSPRLHAPRIPIGTNLDQFGSQILHTGMHLSSIDGKLDEEVLRFGKLGAQLGVLDGQGKDESGRVVAHPAITLNKAVKATTSKEGGNLGEYIGVSALNGFIDKDLVLGESADYDVPGTQMRGRGITAENFLAICKGYVAALQAGALTTQRQREIAVQSGRGLPAAARLLLRTPE